MVARAERPPEDWTTVAVTAALVLSVGAHVAFYGAIPALEMLPLTGPDANQVDVVVTEPEPKPEPEPVAAAEPEANPETATPVEPPEPRPQPAQRPDVAPPPPDTPPPPAQETPVRFDGTTLTNEGAASGWSMAAGSGESREGPLAPPGAPTGREREGVEGGVPGGTGEPRPGPRVVPLADLSRPPRPPSQDVLDGLLRRFFPPEARKQEIEGTATVRMRIDRDGSIGSARAVDEDPEGHGFARACRQLVLKGPRWPGAGLDENGEAVATWVTFRCQFRFR